VLRNVDRFSFEDLIIETADLHKKILLVFNPAFAVIMNFLNSVYSSNEEMQKFEGKDDDDDAKKEIIKNLLKSIGYEVTISSIVDDALSGFKSAINDYINHLNELFSEVKKDLTVANPQVVERQLYQVWEIGFSKALRELGQLNYSAQRLVQILENDPFENKLGDFVKGVIYGAMGPIGWLLGGLDIYNKHEKSKSLEAAYLSTLEEFKYWADKFYNDRILQIYKDLANAINSYAEQLKRHMFTLVNILDNTEKSKLRDLLNQNILYTLESLKDFDFNNFYYIALDLMKIEPNDTNNPLKMTIRNL